MSKRALSRINKTVYACIAWLMLLAIPCAHAADDYLPPEQAFRFSARMVDAKTIDVTYRIAPGYYMYRERFAFRADGATLGAPVIPPGKVKFDETFQKNVETYHDRVTVTLPVLATGRFTLTATGQGCADKGLCYPPMETVVELSPNGGSGLAGAIDGAQQADDPFGGSPRGAPAMSLPRSEASGPTAAPGVAAADTATDPGRIATSLHSGKLIAIVPLFLLLGLGLAFTPCVLPMVPILSFIIVGEGAQASRKRSLLLSFVYSLGMAVIYTGLGIAAGLAGEGLSASLQQPAILTFFAALMVLLSLAMFGVYQVQMPAAVQMKLLHVSNSQTAGKLFGVFTMGALSALVVGPCVAAPLAGALIYISQTRDVVIGGSALFAMATGMSIPLLLVGISAGTLLPRAGPWMAEVKRFFGVIMLAMALWIIAPVLPAWLQMLGWAALAGGYGGYLLLFTPGQVAPKVLGTGLTLLGLLQLTGAVTGAPGPLQPLAKLTGAPEQALHFTRVKSVAELDAALARAQGKTVLLDFYADWCVSCKEMEKFTFADASVQRKLVGMVLLQADVTANSADDKALLQRFQLFGPPGIIFFDKQGREIPARRVIGYQSADKFIDSVGKAQAL